ncbi:MAG: UpxY family transcription antiterminator [Prevotella sp.]|nr:UpxY family transcription antiterminator [Prevotella sp.]
MEDTTNLSPKADASLYNGQPSDTGLSCPSAGLTSCTPSISKNKGGVSVENVPAGNKQWFVLRVSYGRIDKAKTFVEAKGLECYVPLQYKEVRKQGKKRIITTPLLPSLIFVHATAEQVEALLHDNKVMANESRALLSYYFNHTIHRQGNPDRNPPLIIRDEAMNNFICLTSIKNPHIIHVTSNNIQFKLGDMVVVTEGEFKGVHGRVARIAGQQRVVVELFDGCLVATAYVPKEAMTKSETLLNKSKI